MKKLIACFLLVACHTAITWQNPEGIYVCRFENEFSKVTDTLLLQKLSNNYYKITRHSGVTNNKKQIITEVWKLEFDKEKNVFNEMKFGKIIIWDEDKSILIFGNREYKKL
jgi:hypothetical protein